MLLLVIALLAVVTYGAYNWQKYGNIFGHNYPDIDEKDLFTLGSLYDGKNICTKGYYVESSGASVLKINLDTDLFTRSIWVLNNSGRQVFVDALGDGKAVQIKMCGKFESGAGKGFGQPSVYNQQLTVEGFELLGATTKLSP